MTIFTPRMAGECFTMSCAEVGKVGKVGKVGEVGKVGRGGLFMPTWSQL